MLVRPWAWVAVAEAEKHAAQALHDHLQKQAADYEKRFHNERRQSDERQRELAELKAAHEKARLELADVQAEMRRLEEAQREEHANAERSRERLEAVEWGETEGDIESERRLTANEKSDLALLEQESATAAAVRIQSVWRGKMVRALRARS